MRLRDQCQCRVEDDAKDASHGFSLEWLAPPNGSRLSGGTNAGGRKRSVLRYLPAGAQTQASAESRHEPILARLTVASEATKSARKTRPSQTAARARSLPSRLI